MSHSITIFLVLQSMFAWGQQEVVMKPEQMIKLMPNQLEGYRVVEENKGRTLKIGTITYSMVERSFVKNKRKITMLLFDYSNAPIMYHQATSKWASQQPIETDTLSQRAFSVNQNAGWEFYHKLNNTSQLSLGINKRFYMILNGADVHLDVLHRILDMLALQDFPGQSIDFTAPKTR